jgi:MFS family permease
MLGCFPLSEGVAWTTIFPYIYSMVKSFSSPQSSDKNIAIYAGLMVSVFTFGEFIMAPQWAKISDHIGRKPTILVGSMGAVFSALLFGFSTSLPMAIVARTCAGLLNPNLGVVQTFVGELVSKEQQGMADNQTAIIFVDNLMGLFCTVAKGFSVVPFLRGLGYVYILIFIVQANNFQNYHRTRNWRLLG